MNRTGHGGHSTGEVRGGERREGAGGVRRRDAPRRGETRSDGGPRRAPSGLRLALALPLLVGALLPHAFAGGGTRRWFGGRGESQRAEAQAAKDAAAAAFYELDTAQRGLRISIEAITAVDSSPDARRAVEGFDALGRRIDEVSHTYIGAVDAHDLDRDELDAAAAAAPVPNSPAPRRSWTG